MRFAECLRLPNLLISTFPFSAMQGWPSHISGKMPIQGYGNSGPPLPAHGQSLGTNSLHRVAELESLGYSGECLVLGTGIPLEFLCLLKIRFLLKCIP